jgi:hypothetical protein
LRTSFCTVPRRLARGTPCFRASAQYSASSTHAVALIVIDVETSPSGIESNSRSTSLRLFTGTPTSPASSRASGWSES